MNDPIAPGRFGDLGRRIISGVLFAVVVLLCLWAGGLWTPLLAAVLLVGMLWELDRMTTNGNIGTELLLPAVFAVFAAFVAYFFGLAFAGVILLVGAGACLALQGRAASWMAGGLIYTGLAICYLVVLRSSEANGFHVLLWLVSIVIAADVGAYFVGRAVQGPKLWPSVSPGKTWSGALGGLIGAVTVCLMVGPAVGFNPSLGLAAAGLLLGLASQGGDLLESAVKRHHGVKDSSALIPGHGGLLDRLDGLMASALLMAFFHAFGVVTPS